MNISIFHVPRFLKFSSNSGERNYSASLPGPGASLSGNRTYGIFSYSGEDDLFKSYKSESRSGRENK